MSLARIISSSREEVVSLERELRNRGFVTEVVAPGEVCTHPADVELTVEALTGETARQNLKELQNFEGEILLAKGVRERLAPGPIVAQMAHPVEVSPEPACAQIVVEEIQPEIMSDAARDDFEMAPPAVQVQPETPVVEEQQIIEERTVVEQPAVRTEGKRRPVVGPLLLHVGNQLRDGVVRSSGVLRRGAQDIARRSRVSAGKAVGRLRIFCSSTRRQGTAGFRHFRQLVKAANREFVKSYSAACVCWHAQREMRRSKKIVRVEDAQTAAFNSTSSRSIAHPMAPIRLSSTQSSRQRDWELALVGAAIASCLIVIVFGITSRPTKAAAASPSHAAITVSGNAPAAPAPAVEKPQSETKPQPVVTMRRNSRHEQASGSSEYADDVVIRHYDAPKPHAGAEKTSAVKYYSDEQ